MHLIETRHTNTPKANAFKEKTTVKKLETPSNTEQKLLPTVKENKE